MDTPQNASQRPSPDPARARPASIVCIGECMIELRHLADRTLALGFGGDTLNTAVYLARYDPASGATVHYATVLGDDAYSDEMVRGWRAEGIATDLVARLPGGLPGLYIIRTGDDGERSFVYYRSASAARRLFDDDVDGGLGARLAGFAWLYLSGITLSILDPSARTRLWATLDDARRQGARVAFDTNYRPAGWADPGAARAALRTTLERVDLALPSLDDEQRLFGDADARACAQRLHAGGVGEVVVKQGAGGCLVSTGGRAVHVPATRPVEPVDTPRPATRSTPPTSPPACVAPHRRRPPAAATAWRARWCATPGRSSRPRPRRRWTCPATTARDPDRYVVCGMRARAVVPPGRSARSCAATRTYDHYTHRVRIMASRKAR